MHVVLETTSGEHADIEVVLGSDDATVGDLVDAVRAGNPPATNGPAAGILLDGRFCHADLALEEIGLHEGARVRLATTAPSPGGAEPTALEIRVVAGLDAGRRLALPSTGAEVGRGDGALSLVDGAVSRHHLCSPVRVGCAPR